jgi:hypothetical protein
MKAVGCGLMLLVIVSAAAMGSVEAAGDLTWQEGMTGTIQIR